MTNQRLMARIVFAVLRFATSALPVIAFFLSLGSLILSAATYESRMAEYILPLYPPYQVAQQGLKALEDRKHTAQGAGGVDISVGVLDIDHPAWTVILDFVQSEIAIRKSERNEPGPAMFTPKAPPGASEAPKPIKLPEIDFQRIKTITSVELPSSIKAGTKSLVPPYRLVVFFPHAVARRVYEFLSFREFWLDLRQMLVTEVRFISILVAACSLLLSAALSLVSWLLRCYAPHILLPPSRLTVDG